MAADICEQVTSCRRNGGTACDRSTDSCPPCIYEFQDAFTCWEKNNVTNTCPFTGVKYDCSNEWTQSGNGTATAAPTTSDNSDLIMYAAIGGGALLVVILLIVFIVRRRRRGRNMPQFGMHSPQAFNTKRGGAKQTTANTPYANVPPTGKANGAYGYHRKHSDPVLLESSMVNPSSDYSTNNTTTDSLDAMLTDNTPPTAVLGDPPLPRTRSKRGISRNFPRLNSGGSGGRSSAAYKEQKTSRPKDPHPHAPQHVAHPPSRYMLAHDNPNVLGEYLKLKQQLDSDSTSDYPSDTLSLDRFSVQSGSTIGGAESEYLGDLMRSRTESECFSEMSYNDEKYSFSEGDDTDLSASVVRKLDKEVEI